MPTIRFRFIRARVLGVVSTDGPLAARRTYMEMDSRADSEPCEQGTEWERSHAQTLAEWRARGCESLFRFRYRAGVAWISETTKSVLHVSRRVQSTGGNATYFGA